MNRAFDSRISTIHIIPRKFRRLLILNEINIFDQNYQEKNNDAAFGSLLGFFREHGVITAIQRTELLQNLNSSSNNEYNINKFINKLQSYVSLTESNTFHITVTMRGKSFKEQFIFGNALLIFLEYNRRQDDILNTIRVMVNNYPTWNYYSTSNCSILCIAAIVAIVISFLGMLAGGITAAVCDSSKHYCLEEQGDLKSEDYSCTTLRCDPITIGSTTTYNCHDVESVCTEFYCQDNNGLRTSAKTERDSTCFWPGIYLLIAASAVCGMATCSLIIKCLSNNSKYSIPKYIHQRGLNTHKTKLVDQQVIVKQIDMIKNVILPKVLRVGSSPNLPDPPQANPPSFRL